MRQTLTLVAASLLLLASCSPSPTATRPISTPAAVDTAGSAIATALPTAPTQEGVTLTMLSVRYGESGTGITLQIQVDPRWQFSADKTPPQQALPRDPVLSDEAGNIYAPRSSSGGLPTFDPATGGVKYEYNIAFDPVSPQAQILTLQVVVELSEIPANQPLTLTTLGHQLGETWDFNQEMALFSMPIEIKSAHLATLDDYLLDGTLRPLPMLEFTTDIVEQNGLRLSCLRMTPDTYATLEESGYNDCKADEKQIVSSVALSPDANETGSLQFNVTGNLILIEPFRISWPVTGK
jgi:hypothetical protein